MFPSHVIAKTGRNMKWDQLACPVILDRLTTQGHRPPHSRGRMGAGTGAGSPRAYRSGPRPTCLCSRSRRRSASWSGCIRRCGNGTPAPSRGCCRLGGRPGPGARSAAATHRSHPRSRGHRRRPTAQGCRRSCCTGSWRGRRWALGRAPRRSRPGSPGPSRRRKPGQCTCRHGSGTRRGSTSWELCRRERQDSLVTGEPRLPVSAHSTDGHTGPWAGRTPVSRPGEAAGQWSGAP